MHMYVVPVELAISDVLDDIYCLSILPSKVFAVTILCYFLYGQITVSKLKDASTVERANQSGNQTNTEGHAVA
jgi:hypothetical protein